MTTPAIQGSASVGAPLLAPAKAEWIINTEEKKATASILGGLATISRDPNTGKFKGHFHLDVPEDGDKEAGHIEQSFPLIDCDNLPMAQRRAETLIRENLGKTHSELLEAATAGEQAEAVEAAGPDPF